MKKLAIICAALVSFAFCNIDASAAQHTIIASKTNQNAYPQKIRIRDADNSGVVLRTRANDNTKLTGSGNPHFKTGYIFTCTGEQGSYYQVSYNGGYYYIPKKYAEPVTTNAAPKTVIIRDADNAGLVLRTRPNESTKLTGRGNPHFYSGDRLSCVGISGNYYKVVWDGDYYYIPKKYAVPY